LNSEIKKSEGEKSLFISFLDILESFVIAVACVVFIFLFIARLSVVSGDSMNKTLKNNDYLLVVNPFFTYEPENGDIVVIHGNYENYKLPIVKRVIATEGQTLTINIETKQVFINGELLNEDYAYYLPGIPLKIPQTEGGEYNSATGEFTVTVPKGHVFVMGDNRNNSLDSRFYDVGYIDERYIIGQVIYRFLPFDGFGPVK